MGRRKERRLAAMSAAGRRVKLDLFAEPSSGDLGGSSRKEVQGDLDQDNAGVLNSPSSSRQCQDNPLLLLGQYSDDDDFTEEANGKNQDSIAEAPLTAVNGKEDEPLEGRHGNREGKESEYVVGQKIDKDELKESPQSLAIPDLDGNGIEENGVGSLGDSCKKVDSIAKISDSLTPGMQGDSSSGWKIVIHEESSQYYYWNTETGETSWEAPKALSHVAETASEHDIAPIIEERQNIHSSTSTSCNINEQHALYSNAITDPESARAHLSEAKKKIEVGVEKENTNEEHEDEIQGRNISGGLSGNEQKGGQISMISDFKETSNNQLMGNEGPDRWGAPDLVEYGQKLVQKLKELENVQGLPQGNVWFSKYIFEIELRLSDLKSLSVYGASLLPFWTHSENKLRALGSSIDSEISLFCKSANLNEVGNGQFDSCEGESSVRQNLVEDAKMEEKGQVPVSHPSPNIDPLEVAHKEDNHRSPSVDANPTHISPSTSPMTHTISGDGLQEVNKSSNPVGLTIEPDSFAVDDMDMDVDMEVDEETTSDHRTPEDPSGVEHSISQGNIQPDSHTMECLEKELSVPPPDDDWIPPPPDNEPLPPPPPDEPIASAYPPQPTYSGTALQFHYSDHYNLAYPISNFQYYGLVISGTASASYYVHTEGQQTTDPQPSQYCGTTSNMYSDTTTIMVNPAEPQPSHYYGTESSTYAVATSLIANSIEHQPSQYYGTESSSYHGATPVTVNPAEQVIYYELPNGAAPAGPVINGGGLESSSFLGESGPSVNCADGGAGTGAGAGAGAGASATGQVGSLRGLAESGGILSTNLKAETDATAVSSKTETKAVTVVQIQSASTVNQTTPATVEDNVLASSAPASAPVASSSAAKNQSKVLRNKKRAVAVAPTLRANKKVSSLVDKLHEDEDDEPGNAYEILERKRQREIEEWRAQQIASGEAKENANFLPLGGDWRERVKRKRAQSASNAGQIPPDESTSEKQRPDLIELAKGLPSGWQAYWDDASKEVYYGNVLTSETKWTRPTK